MRYSYKKKNNNNNRKRKTIKKKRSYKKRRYQKGGGCGCSGKISGGSSGPSNLSQLSPNNYNPYYNVAEDPTNMMVSTSVPSNVITGGRQSKKGKGKGKRTKKMTGGISGVDMLGSLGNASSINNVSNYLTGSNYTNTPGFFDNILSVNQPTTILPNMPYVPPGISVLV